MAVQGQDQELETQDQGRGCLASRVLEVKAMSLRTPYLMCIKGVLRTEHCLQYCTVHHLFHDDKNYDWRIGGVPGPPGPPLGYAHETANINFINSGAEDIIRTTYYIHGPELMKLIFAVLYVSRTMGLTRCYKTERFFYIYDVVRPMQSE